MQLDGNQTSVTPLIWKKNKESTKEKLRLFSVQTFRSNYTSNEK